MFGSGYKSSKRRKRAFDENKRSESENSRPVREKRPKNNRSARKKTSNRDGKKLGLRHRG